MSRRMKILIAVVASVFLLGIAGTVAVLAQSPTPTSTPIPGAAPPARPNINARVAQILGIPETQLTDAIKQARTALATPTATPATPATPSTPIKPGVPARPPRFAPIKPADLYAKVAQILNNPNITADKIAAAYQQAQKEFRDQAVTNYLDRARQNGKITQDEENQIKQWLQNRPAAVDKLGIPFGPGQIGPRIQGAIRNFQSHMRDFQNRLNNIEGKLKSLNPTPTPK
jgi:hypothetical protein